MEQSGITRSYFALLDESSSEDDEDKMELIIRVITIDHRTGTYPWNDELSKRILELKVLNCIQNWHGEMDVKIASMNSYESVSDYCEIMAMVYDIDGGDKDEGGYIQHLYSLEPVKLV